MAALMALLVIYFISSSSACGSASVGPSFCGDNDCPEFTVVETNENFEVRRYSAATWVSTEMTGMTRDEASREGFGRLFSYISGDNEGGVKVPMTAPVTMKVQEGSMTQSFFIPFQHQANPPTPSSGNVFISEVPEHEVYVRSFGGRASADDFSTEANTLKESLVSAGASFQQDMYMTAGYDAPFQMTGRHNEVWYMKM